MVRKGFIKTGDLNFCLDVDLRVNHIMSLSTELLKTLINIIRQLILFKNNLTDTLYSQVWHDQGRDEAANDTVIRTHPLYKVVLVVRSTVLDSDSDHHRHFLKISFFLNKGIDLIDLSSILKYKTIESAITYYF